MFQGIDSCLLRKILLTNQADKQEWKGYIVSLAAGEGQMGYKIRMRTTTDNIESN